ncbi:uncharacterized protein LOC103980421 [Musa acuminata AAA Group]|uniref:uncharacterized protein LOC103980421 n=1 Tax=Musa acuminata AAA Group TaxID=214697 RepID=UPI0031D10907
MMMLRSSSTPILGSLLSSSSSLHFSESPNNFHPHNSPNPNLHTLSCHFSPASDGLHDQSPSLGIRRSRSDGNLHSFLSEQSDDPNHHYHLLPPSLKCSSARRAHPALESIPSFSLRNPNTLPEEEEEEEEEDDQENDEQGAAGGFGFASDDRKGGLKYPNPDAESPAPPPLFLARGLGIDRVGSGLLTAGGGDGGIGGGRSGKWDVLTGNGGEQSDVETYYKKMVEENPSNALFLRNYAQYLYQAKGDLKRAEEYYSRAILVDPGDGEILSQYAKLVWELHHDEERACSYFQQAVQAAPQDSHVLAAYAGFLWETEEEDGGGSQDFMVESARSGGLAPATA